MSDLRKAAEMALKYFEGAYGLDNAVTQLKFVYGINDWFTIGAARSEFAYDFSGKFLLKSQEVIR